MREPSTLVRSSRFCGALAGNGSRHHVLRFPVCVWIAHVLAGCVHVVGGEEQAKRGEQTEETSCTEIRYRNWGRARDGGVSPPG